MGEKLFVEVHIVLDSESNLQIAHDIGTSLKQLDEYTYDCISYYYFL
jgi:divalent metal cation (Fe/Co/Zn/Cd) transporter